MRISDWSSACALPISTRISDCDVPGSAAPSRPPSPAPAAPPKRSSPPEPHRSSVSSCSWTAPSEHDGTARPPINSTVPNPDPLQCNPRAIGGYSSLKHYCLAFDNAAWSDPSMLTPEHTKAED